MKMIKVVKSAKNEKYILQWWPYERYEETKRKKATFTASSDEEACKKVFEKLYGWQIDEDEEGPKTLQEYKDYFDQVDIGGDDAVVEIRTASGRLVYDSGLDEENEEDWDA